MAARYLSRNEGTEIPTNLVFFDTESIREPHPHRDNVTLLRLRLWSAISVRIENGKATRRKVEHGTDSASFWRFIETVHKSGNRLWLFAHNANFDITQLDFWRLLDEKYYTLEPLYSKPNETTGKQQVTWQGKICAENRPFFVVCRREKRTLTIVDTTNYWSKPLRDIGDDFGMPKLALPSEDDTEEVWRTYCIRDVEILEAAVTGLLLEWKAEKCGVWQLTAPMLAMTNFRHTCDILTPDGKAVDIVCKPDAREHELERKAYFGGRCWCLYVGERTEPIYHLDCNSLYPYVMKENSFPRAFLYYKRSLTNDELTRANRVYGIVAEVAINSRYQTFPVRIDGSQYHCTGTFWTVLCGRELQRAIDAGVVHRSGVVQFYSIAPLFREWVSYWYARKSRAGRTVENRRGSYEFSKLILNSLSGKFAQHGRRWRDRHECIPPVAWGGYIQYDNDTDTYNRWRSIGGNAQSLTDAGEPPHAFPAISAFITAAAREYMLSVIEACGAGNVFYMATDSIICNQEGYNNLLAGGFIDGEEIGKFKILGVHGQCRIYGANYYELDNDTTASGIMGVVAKARKAQKKPELFEQVSSVISRQPDGTIALTGVDVPEIIPDFRGSILPSGYWHPYRLTLDIDFTDRPARSPLSFSDLLDTERDRIPLVELL